MHLVSSLCRIGLFALATNHPSRFKVSECISLRYVAVEFVADLSCGMWGVYMEVWREEWGNGDVRDIKDSVWRILVRRVLET